MEFQKQWTGERLGELDWLSLQKLLLEAGFFDIEAVIRNDTLYSAENVAALESRNLKIYRLANGAGVRCAGWMLWSPNANSGIDGGGATVCRFILSMDPEGHGFL